MMDLRVRKDGETGNVRQHRVMRAHGPCHRGRTAASLRVTVPRTLTSPESCRGARVSGSSSSSRLAAQAEQFQLLVSGSRAGRGQSLERQSQRTDLARSLHGARGPQFVVAHADLLRRQHLDAHQLRIPVLAHQDVERIPRLVQGRGPDDKEQPGGLDHWLLAGRDAVGPEALAGAGPAVGRQGLLARGGGPPCAVVGAFQAEAVDAQAQLAVLVVLRALNGRAGVRDPSAA